MRVIEQHFPALTHAAFRNYWYGQMISLLGTWMHRIGIAWLVYDLTKSAFKLGLIGAIQFLPLMLLSLFAGVIADRFPKKYLVLIAQFVAMIAALIMAILVFTNLIEFWHIAVIAFILGLTQTIDIPARQALMTELVGTEHLVNAVGLNSSSFNLARIVGPSIAGLVIVAWGVGWCFLINAISFLAVLYALLKIPDGEVKKNKDSSSNIFSEIKEGLSYVFHRPALAHTLFKAIVISVFAFNFDVLLPVLSKTKLGLETASFSYLMSCLGIGALGGALFTTLMSRFGPRTQLLLVIGFLVGLMHFLIGLSTSVWLTAILLVVCGFFSIVFGTNANSTLQLNSDQAHRGRVMSLYSLVFAGLTPIGNFFSGSVAEHFGASIAYATNGLMMMSLLFFFSLYNYWARNHNLYKTSSGNHC